MFIELGDCPNGGLPQTLRNALSHLKVLDMLLTTAVGKVIYLRFSIAVTPPLSSANLKGSIPAVDPTKLDSRAPKLVSNEQKTTQQQGLTLAAQAGPWESPRVTCDSQNVYLTYTRFGTTYIRLPSCSARRKADVLCPGPMWMPESMWPHHYFMK